MNNNSTSISQGDGSVKSETHERAFKGAWMPGVILHSKKMTSTMKVLLIEIDSLDDGNGCTASNEYLSWSINETVSCVRRSITAMRKARLIIDLPRAGKRRRIRSVHSEYTRVRAATCAESAQNLPKEDSDLGEMNYPPPTLEEVVELCAENDIDINERKFHAHYELKGWHGSSLEALIRYWAAHESTDKGSSASRPRKSTGNVDKPYTIEKRIEAYRLDMKKHMIGRERAEMLGSMDDWHKEHDHIDLFIKTDIQNLRMARERETQA